MDNIELNKVAEEIKDMLDDVVKAKSMKEIMTQGKDESDEDYAKRMKQHKKEYHSETTTKAEDLSDEDISKNYESDDEHVDNWNNFEKACWSGYKQVGMKNKGGKKVPNCVPINKATGLPEEPTTSWNGVFKPKVD